MRARVGLLTLTGVALSACTGWYNPFAGVNALISLAVLIAQIVIAFDIIQSRRSTGTKVLWIAFVFLIPIIGVLTYLIFERK